MRVLLVLLVLIVAFVGAISIASETGGEVVVVTTRDDSGREFETSLWIVEHRGSQYLRAGDRGNSWYVRLKARPRIKMERHGTVGFYRAVPEPALNATIDELMARDYGWADQLIGLMRDPSQSMAIRLERINESDY